MINPRIFLRFVTASLCIAAVAHAQGGKKSPTSKLYVADTEGDVQIDTGKIIEDLTKRSVFNAAGTVIQTKPNSNASIVLSNGTGIYFDVNTRVEIRQFEQEPFRPNRSDIEDEPSISTTRMFVNYGVIGISASKLVAGSTMVFETSLATAAIRGRQAVVMAADNLTIISMIQGDATVQAGPLNRPLLVRDGQQIIIRPGKPGEANIVEIVDIPEGHSEEASQWLDERVVTSDAARKLVYFEVQARNGSSGLSGDLSLFDGSSPEGSGGNEIVAVPIVPVIPPVQPNVSPANLSGR